MKATKFKKNNRKSEKFQTKNKGSKAHPINPNASKITKPQRSKKHKKLKSFDAQYEGDWAVQWKKDKLKLSNQRPVNDDQQEVPRGVKAIQKWKESKPEKPEKKRKKSRTIDNHVDKIEKGMTRPLKPAAKFQQGKHESEDAFMNRVERETQVVIQKSQFEDKYKIDVDKLQTGQNKKRGKKKIREMNRLKDKKEKKKGKLLLKRNESKMDFSKFKDHVEFGEVAMQPPSLTSKPRKAGNTDSKAKPGRKALLLKEVIAQNLTKSNSVREVGQTLKRKHMSFAQQRITDTERDKAIQRYREMKLKKKKVPTATLR